MTARDDAISAALATGVPIHKGLIANVIDAIPPRVLAQLAIDTGALEQTGWLRLDHCEEPTHAGSYGLCNRADCENSRVRVYRLAEDGGLGGS